jgi:hypothetical protein
MYSVSSAAVSYCSTVRFNLHCCYAQYLTKSFFILYLIKNCTPQVVISVIQKNSSCSSSSPFVCAMADPHGSADPYANFSREDFIRAMSGGVSQAGPSHPPYQHAHPPAPHNQANVSSSQGGSFHFNQNAPPVVPYDVAYNGAAHRMPHSYADPVNYGVGSFAVARAARSAPLANEGVAMSNPYVKTEYMSTYRENNVPLPRGKRISSFPMSSSFSHFYLIYYYLTSAVLPQPDFREVLPVPLIDRYRDNPFNRLDASHVRHSRLLFKLGFPTIDREDPGAPVLIPYNILPPVTDLNKEKVAFNKLVNDKCTAYFEHTHPDNLKVILYNLGDVVNAFISMKKDLMTVTRKFMENEFEGYFNLIHDQVRCQVGCDPLRKLVLPEGPSDIVRALCGGSAKSHLYILQAFKECEHCPLFSTMVRSSVLCV